MPFPKLEFLLGSPPRYGCDGLSRLTNLTKPDVRSLRAQGLDLSRLVEKHPSLLLREDALPVAVRCDPIVTRPFAESSPKTHTGTMQAAACVPKCQRTELDDSPCG